VSNTVDRLTKALADRYTIERELGAGGMATVYLAEDLKHKRNVAVKVLRPELAAILGADRFLKEIEVTANLQHPHILPLFDSGEAEAFLYYVMPYVEGESLRHKLDREKQLSIDEAVRLTTEVADALHYAHQRNVIHRDIKPENILLHDGSAMVADFGIALAVQQAGGNRLTETGLSLGTPQYMSPEQATADRELDAKSDVYSLGAVLYEMLAGDPPHTGSTAQAVIASVVTKAPELVSERRASVPAPIAGAVHRALEKLPADRFASAAHFSKALTDPAAAVSLSAGRKSAATSRFGWVKTAGVAAAALIVGLAVGRLTSRDPAARGQEVRFFHIPDSSHRVNTLCCGPLFAISPQGDRIAYTGIAPISRGIYVRDLSEMNARALPETQGGHSLFFSPDGEWVGFGARGAIYKTLVSGGFPTHVTDVGGTLVGGTWTDDGEIIFSTWPTDGYGDTEVDHGLFAVSADGGTPRRISTPDSSSGAIDHRTPFAVPGSDWLLVTLWPASNLTYDARIAVVSRASGRVEPLLAGMAPQYTKSGHLVYATATGSVLGQRFDLADAGPLAGPQSLLVDEERDGAAAVFTAGGGWADFAVSTNGTMLFMRGDEGSALDILNRSGTVTASPFEARDISHLDSPRFSPDGRRVALAVAIRSARRPSGATVQGFQARHFVYVVDLNSGASQRITLEGDARSFVVDQQQLFLQPADRSAAARPIMQSSGASLNGFSIGRRYIAVAVRTGPETNDILVASRDSADRAWLFADTDFNEAAPTISPDERWLAYSSDETGLPEIYVSALPWPGARTIVSVDGGTEPVWSSDGRTLYYRSRTDVLVAVSVAVEGDRLVVRDREELYAVNSESDTSHREYDVSPSQEEFVFVRLRGFDRRLGVVLNAIAERQ
jgi:serine/threonine-protein kinase